MSGVETATPVSSRSGVFQRLARLVVALALVGFVLALVLRGPLTRLRREVLVERALDSLAAGLESHRAALGRFPAEPMLGGGELAVLLLGEGHLQALPLNPDTGEPFGQIDLEVDLLFYSGTEEGESFLLEALDGRGERVVGVRSD